MYSLYFGIENTDCLYYTFKIILLFCIFLKSLNNIIVYQLYLWVDDKRKLGVIIHFWLSSWIFMVKMYVVYFCFNIFQINKPKNNNIHGSIL